MGRSDISGDDWGDTFAAAVNGIHLKSPLGLADITLGNTAWSAKTVKSTNPLTQSTVRLISGRNSPIFSSGSQDFFSDVQETGNQVLQIWNARVEEAAHKYPHLRTVVLMRNMDRFRFKIFEFPTVQFDPADYEWAINTRGNWEGRSVHSNLHTFTWQPHGSQFTVIRQVSASARSFEVRKPGVLDAELILLSLQYSPSWVRFL